MYAVVENLVRVGSIRDVPAEGDTVLCTVERIADLQRAACALNLNMECLLDGTVHKIRNRKSYRSDDAGLQGIVPSLQTLQRQFCVCYAVANDCPCGIACTLNIAVIGVGERSTNTDKLTASLLQVTAQVNRCVGSGVAVVGRVDGTLQRGNRSPCASVVKASLDGQCAFCAHVQALAAADAYSVEPESHLQ